MNNEFLKMQKLAGLITESEYKEKIEEEEVRGKIGKSYPAPGTETSSEPAPTKDVLTQPNLGLSPEQYEKIKKEVIKAYKEYYEEDDAEYAFDYLYKNLFFGEGWEEGKVGEYTLLKRIGVNTPKKIEMFDNKKRDITYDMMGWDKNWDED
jgi:hypothetical protein